MERKLITVDLGGGRGIKMWEDEAIAKGLIKKPAPKVEEKMVEPVENKMAEPVENKAFLHAEDKTFVTKRQKAK